jgi:glycosyltransferase involved in cell wall biosynthesis
MELCRRFASEFGQSFELIVARGKRPAGLSQTVVHEIEYVSKSMVSRLRARRRIAKILCSRPPAIFINEFVPIPFRSLKKHSHFQVVYDLRHLTENQRFRDRMVYTRLLKRQWVKSEYIITCSEFMKGELVRLTGCRLEDMLISYFGIDEKLLEPAKIKPEKDIDILFVGHFEKRKNHANFLKALAMIGKGLRVELIGLDNGRKTELQTLARDLGLTHVHMFTLNDDNKLWEYYRRSRLFVFPSNYEGFGIPLIESLALGTPVACSDIPVFREIGGRFVDYFNQHEPEHMASVISKALKHPRIPADNDTRDFLRPYRWNAIYEKFVRDLIMFSSKLGPNRFS